MRIYPDKLAADLERQLRPVYLISGDEALLVQESADQVRAAARRGGCSERRVLDAADRSFAWRDLVEDASSLSLFAERRLIELRLPGGKPGSDGSQALLTCLGNAGDDVLLIVAGKIDRASMNSKWYRAIDDAGATVQIWPVGADELPRWLQRRAAALGLRMDREAVGLLAERVQGNLLAAVQELEKLRLLSPDGVIDAARVSDAVADNARFTLFGLIDVALAGRAHDSLRMLHGVRAEGAQAPALIWGLVRELQLLRGLAVAVEGGRSAAQAVAQARVWKSREAVVQAALARHSSASCARLLDLAAQLDAAAKGFGPGNPWEIAELLVLGIAGDGVVPIRT